MGRGELSTNRRASLDAIMSDMRRPEPEGSHRTAVRDGVGGSIITETISNDTLQVDSIDGAPARVIKEFLHTTEIWMNDGTFFRENNLPQIVSHHNKRNEIRYYWVEANGSGSKQNAFTAAQTDRAGQNVRFQKITFAIEARNYFKAQFMGYVSKNGMQAPTNDFSFDFDGNLIHAAWKNVEGADDYGMDNYDELLPSRVTYSAQGDPETVSFKFEGHYGTPVHTPHEIEFKNGGYFEGGETRLTWFDDSARTELAVVVSDGKIDLSGPRAEQIKTANIAERNPDRTHVTIQNKTGPDHHFRLRPRYDFSQELLLGRVNLGPAREFALMLKDQLPVLHSRS